MNIDEIERLTFLLAQNQNTTRPVREGLNNDMTETEKDSALRLLQLHFDEAERLIAELQKQVEAPTTKKFRLPWQK